MSTNPGNIGDEEDEEAEDVGSDQFSTNGNNGHDVNTPTQLIRNIGPEVGTRPLPTRNVNNGLNVDTPPQPFQNGDNGSDSSPPQPTIREGGSNVVVPLTKRGQNLGNRHTTLTKGGPKHRKRPTPLITWRPKPGNRLTPAINTVSKPEKPRQIGTQPESFLNGNNDPAVGTPRQLLTNGNSGRDIGIPPESLLSWYSGPDDGTPRLPFQSNGNSGRDKGTPPESLLSWYSGPDDGTPRLPFQSNGNSGRDTGTPPESLLSWYSGPDDGTPRLPFQSNGNSGRDIGALPESFLNGYSGPTVGTLRLPFQTNGNSGRDIGAPPESFLNGNRGSLGSSSNRNRCPQVVGPYQSSIGGRRPNVVDPFELLYTPQRGPRSLSPSSSLYISHRLNAVDQRTVANFETGVNGQYTTGRNIDPTGSNRYMISDHVGNRVAGNLGTGANFGGYTPPYNHVDGNVNRTPSTMSVTTHLIQGPAWNSSNNTPIDYSIRFAPLPPRYPYTNAGTTGVGTSTAAPHVASSSLVREYIHHQVPNRTGYNIPNSGNGGLTSQESRAVAMRQNLIQVPAYMVGDVDVGPSTSGSYLQNRSDPLSRSGNHHSYNVVWNPNVSIANSARQRAPAATATATSDPVDPQLSYSEERPDEEENSTE